MDNSEKNLELHNALNDTIAKVTHRCYDLFGMDHYEGIARKVLSEESKIDDIELNRLMKEYKALIEEDAKTNPWIKLI